MRLTDKSRRQVYDFYRQRLDKRYPNGYKIITHLNTKEFYMFDISVMRLRQMRLFLNYNGNVDGVNIWTSHVNTINIGTAAKGPVIGREKIKNNSNLREVKIDYSPLHTVVYKESRSGGFITLSDDTAVIPDPSNDLSKSEWYLSLSTGYVNVDYTDLVSKDTKDVFGDLMSEL